MVTHPFPETKMLTFSHRVRQRAQDTGGWLCVGLDPLMERLPNSVPRNLPGLVLFCQSIVRATQHATACYKINFAFFEALGPEGWNALAAVRTAVPDSIPVIADAKRGDIGSTSVAYARSVFDVLGFDAVTVNPYLGWDALEPFMRYEGRCILVLCKTSNAGSGNMQDVVVDSEPLYMRIARQAREQAARAEVGLVVGGTYLHALSAVRALGEDLVLLVPGVGAQGANASEALQAGANAHGQNALIAVSRDILYASSGADFADAARVAAELFAGHMDAKP